MPGAAKKAAKMTAQRAAATTPEPPESPVDDARSEPETPPAAAPDVTEPERPDADAAVKLDDLEMSSDDEPPTDADEPTAHPSVVPPALQTYAPVVGSDGPRSQSELDALG